MANHFIERKQAQAKAEEWALPDMLRAKRAKAFKAWDIFKINVLFMPYFFGLGIRSDSEEAKEFIDEAIGWYLACLDMDHPETVRRALDNIPPYIAQYMDA